MNENHKFGRTTADARAEDFAEMAEEGGLWREWELSAIAEPIKIGRFRSHREVSRGQIAIDAFLQEADIFQVAINNTQEPGYEKPKTD